MMGSLLSPAIANIFMEAFEHETIGSSKLKPKRGCRPTRTKNGCIHVAEMIDD